MFTGIVQGKAKVVGIIKRPLLHRINFSFPTGSLDLIKVGASIALNGTCLTVVDINDQSAPSIATFDVMMQTLSHTNLENLKEGDEVNFERAAKIGDEIGGHLISGHILGTCRVTSIQTPENNVIITFEKPESWGKYIFDKGYIGLNGCSLTIAEVTDDSFSVYLIPETLDVTVFGSIRVGDKVNLEVDAQTQTIVDTLYAMKMAQ